MNNDDACEWCCETLLYKIRYRMSIKKTDDHEITSEKKIPDCFSLALPGIVRDKIKRSLGFPLDG